MSKFENDQVSFDPLSHEYFLAGRRIPGVSEIMGASGLSPDYSMVNQKVLEEACDFGKHAHKVTELWDRGTLDIETVHPKLAGILEGWKKFNSECVVAHLAIETKFISDIYLYGGTLDRLSALKVCKPEEVALIDIKTPKKVPASVKWQLAGYRRAVMEWLKKNDFMIDGFGRVKRVRRFHCRLFDGSYDLQEWVRDDIDDRTFLSGVTIYREKELAGLLKNSKGGNGNEWESI